MSAIGGVLLFPLCQVVIPNNLEYFDIYRKRKEYKNPLIIQVNNNFDKALSIEFWIHNIGYYIDLRDVPLINKRGNIVGSFRYSNKNLTKFTCTMILSESKETNAGIIVANFNTKQPFIFELIPK